MSNNKVYINECLDNGILLNAASSFLDASPIYNSDSCDRSSMSVIKSQIGHLKLTTCNRFVNINFRKTIFKKKYT